ncbi:MAG: helix-turn-helix transcriptional regulator [Nitrososphaerota archaeon]|jgi:DNA-binding PadR family transcriptional regulator|nr:helix-turn-helix transcriptional regulator [Nitrososphaerota archaeon]
MQEEKKVAGWLKETQKGYIRIAVLILLNKKPHHGYEMMKALDKRTKGFWKPTAGGIYPILQDLEKSKYIEGEWDCGTKRKRKIYDITSEGKRVLEYTLEKEKRLVNTMADLLKEYMKDVMAIDVNSTQLSKTPFALFFDEEKCNSEDTKNDLENKRANIEGIIEKLQETIGQINKQLTQIEKEENSKNKK